MCKSLIDDVHMSYDEWQNGLLYILCYSSIIWLPCIDGHWKICDVPRPINIISQSSINTDYTITYLTIFLIVYLSPDISSRCLFNFWQIPLGRNQGPGKLIMITLDLPAIYRTEYARGYYVLCFILLILHVVFLPIFFNVDLMDRHLVSCAFEVKVVKDKTDMDFFLDMNFTCFIVNYTPFVSQYLGTECTELSN